MHYMLAWPFYFWDGLTGIYHLLIVLPWPAPHEWFGSVAIFIGLYPVRIVMKALLPEDTVVRRVYKRRKTGTPSAAEHQGAAAIVTEFLHH